MEVLFVGSDLSLSDYEVLQRGGLTVRFVHLRDLLQGLTVHLADPTTIEFQTAANNLAGTCVWYHPGCFDLLEQSFVGEDTNLHFVTRQYHALLTYLEHWLPGNCFCMDDPHLQRKWSNKIVQLETLTAALSGLLPDTLVVSDPSLIPSGRLVKHVSENRAVTTTEASYAQIIDQAGLDRLQLGALMPVFSQVAIHARLEYRTYCFGSERVTICLPHEEDTSLVDIHFHPDSLANATLVAAPVPDDLFRRMQAVLGLNCMAVDYIVDNSGLFVLEANPLFSWAWMPKQCHPGIIGAVAKFLNTRLLEFGHV